jgi:predicted transcriptional regulator
MGRGDWTECLEGGSRVTLDSLERTTGTLEMIAQLYVEKKLNTTQLIERVHVSQQTAYRAIEKLKEFGLILEEVEGVFPKRKNYILSDRGLQLAEAPIFRWNSLLRNWTPIDLPKGHETAMRRKR